MSSYQRHQCDNCGAEGKASSEMFAISVSRPFWRKAFPFEICQACFPMLKIFRLARAWLLDGEKGLAEALDRHPEMYELERWAELAPPTPVLGPKCTAWMKLEAHAASVPPTDPEARRRWLESLREIYDECRATFGGDD